MQEIPTFTYGSKTLYVINAGSGCILNRVCPKVSYLANLLLRLLIDFGSSLSESKQL